MKVFLVGLRGAGKTTVGRRLAERLGMPFFDTDAMVEEATGRSVRRIFLEQGEMAFREFETRALRRLRSERGSLVAATGGGIMLRPENQVLLPKLGAVVYLRAAPKLLRRRLAAAGERPSLTGKPVEEEVEFLFLTRDPLYRDAADLAVSVEGKDPDRVCEEIERGLSSWKRRLPKSKMEG